MKAPHLTAWTEARRRNAQRYQRFFEEAGLLDRVALPTEPSDRHHVYNQFVIRVPRRDELQQSLAEADIGTEVYYPVRSTVRSVSLTSGIRRVYFPRPSVPPPRPWPCPSTRN